MRQIYQSALIGLKSSSSETTTILNAKYILDFVSAFREDLRLRCDGRIRWPQRGLSYLSRFFRDIESYPLPCEEVISLRLNMEALAIGAANAIYSSYDEEMHNTTEIDDVLFHLQLKFNYVKVEVDLIQLLTRQVAITIGPMKSLIDYVWSELIFFRNYFMNGLKQCKEKTKITVILTSIQSAISQAWSVCDSLCHDLEQENFFSYDTHQEDSFSYDTHHEDSFSNDTEQEDLVREMINCLHFQLLLKFKFIKAAIRQMYPSISASSTLDHPTISLLNFLPMNFEVIDSYFSMLKSSNTSSSHRPMMDEVS